jgi:ABC-2 type transport system permease protein
MQRYLIAMRAMVVRNLINMRRYAFNTISGLVTMYIVFMLLFLGVRGIGGAAIAGGTTLEGLIVSYLLWVLSISAYSDLAWDLNQEAQVGTLEQLYISPIGFNWLNAFNLISGLLLSFVFAGVLLTVMILSTGKTLNLDLASILPLLITAVLSVYGIGFAMGGLALIFKRIQAFFQIFQFVFVAFLALPLDSFPWAQFLPLTMGGHLLRQVMVHGVRLWELPPSSLAVLAFVGIGYLVLGLIIFEWSARIAKRKGLLGHY